MYTTSDTSVIVNTKITGDVEASIRKSGKPKVEDMNYFIPFFVCVTISFNVPSCHCGSYWGELIKEKDNGKYRQYCLTREKMKLFKGSVVTFRNGCFTCKCSNKGLFCEQSYGMMLWVPAGCRSVIDGCEPLLVDAKDEFLRCISRIPTNQKETKVLFTRG